jgi:hypothetical protein
MNLTVVNFTISVTHESITWLILKHNLLMSNTGHWVLI